MNKRRGDKSWPSGSGKQANDPRQLQAAGSTRQMVIDSAPAIIGALIDKAKDGSYLHARMLFEFAGLNGLAEPVAKESPLVEILIRELGLKIDPDPNDPTQEIEQPAEISNGAPYSNGHAHTPSRTAETFPGDADPAT